MQHVVHLVAALGVNSRDTWTPPPLGFEGRGGEGWEGGRAGSRRGGGGGGTPARVPNCDYCVR